MRHQPVLLDEALDLLNVKPGGTYIDGTVGSGGHAAAILDRAGPGGFVLGIDRDQDALKRAEQTLAGRFGRGTRNYDLARGNYSEMTRLARERGLNRVDGVLLDLGVSSEQLDGAERGFSFDKDGPLDMRMDRAEPLTAADLARDLSEEELARLIRELGEDRRARAIARAIVKERAQAPIRTTAKLAGLVERAIGGRRGRIHPATRTFQALRMRVNRELECLRHGLDAALATLAPGGRLAVIAFHSLEDRTVKRFMADHAGRWESLPAGGRAWRGSAPAARLVTRKPVTPSAGEIERNPRARSAKLRVAERTCGNCGRDTPPTRGHMT
ncbi:MAG: 16S rRNA (cytosine(1402)-N(4))-methyltransferase RsmH [Verrucomicrobiota bacterium]|nr:16S rRNA (cytosine(1402)-N(4))-methyltransferase RsmH [Verrucomicrobiota bacterium]